MNTGTDRPGRRVGSDPRRSTPARKIFKAIWAVAGTVGVAISAVVGYMTETQRGVIFQQIANRTRNIVSQEIVLLSGSTDIDLKDRAHIVGLPSDRRASQYVAIDELPQGARATKVVKVESSEAFAALDLKPGNLFDVEPEIDAAQPRAIHLTGRASEQAEAKRHLRIFVEFTAGASSIN
ncbi:MAG: hypothetical protein ACJ8IK_16640 [Burkholderiaceae bacterium]